MNKKILIVIVLCLVFAFGMNEAFASLTFTTNAITGTASSTIDLGSGNNLFLQTSGGKVGIGTVSPGNLLHVNSGATPSASQARFTANGLGSISFLTFAAGNAQMGFDVDWSGSGWVARNAASGWLRKVNDQLIFSGSSGNVVDGVAPQGNLMTINVGTGNVSIGPSTAPHVRLDVGGSSRFTGTSTSVLTGTIDPTASTNVNGVGTLFGTQLLIGDRIIVSGETRTVTAISTDTNLTVDTAFSDNANDTSPDKLSAIMIGENSSGALQFVVNDIGNVGIGAISPGAKLDVKNGHVASSQTTPPTPSVTGTGYSGASLVAGSTDTKGGITATVGAAAGTLVVTFQTVYTSTPVCTITPATATAQIDVGKVYATYSTTALTLNFVATPTGGSETWSYICLQ